MSLIAEKPGRVFETLERLWPLGLLSAAFIPVFPLLFWILADALDASARMPSLMMSSEWGGPEMLFMLASGILGWSTVAVVEYRLGTSGAVLLWVTIPACLIAVGAGFGLAVIMLGALSAPQWAMAYCSAGTATFCCFVRLFAFAEE